jgi:Putative Flp pilus-assembly TadE/G-like
MMSAKPLQIGFSCVRKFSNDERGSVFLALGLAMPVLIGAIGLGMEVSYWRVLHREMQDAAALDVQPHAGEPHVRRLCERPISLSMHGPAPPAQFHQENFAPDQSQACGYRAS